MDYFRFRLNCVDHYQATPSRYDPIFRSDITESKLQNEPKVPIIRIFGATETGQKVCAHVHGAFPYLYVEYEGSLIPEDVSSYIQRIQLNIDHALAVSYRINSKDYNSKFVARITLVKGVPFYGFHVGYKFFLKIYMLNPMVMTRLSDILRQGAVMRQIFQPYEAHLQYLLQWMIDYNLYGCAYINCRRVNFRAPVPSFEETDKQSHIWHDCSIPEEMITEDVELRRSSYCSIEIDVCVEEILNRLDIKPRNLHHNFIERLKTLTPTEKLVPSLASLWKEETRRRKSLMSDPDPGSSPFAPDLMMSLSSGTRLSPQGGWIKETTNREKIKALILEEKSETDENSLTFENFVKPTSLEAAVKTALDAVQDLFPESLKAALGLQDPGIFDPKKKETTEVDEKQLQSLPEDNSENSCDSDEDVVQEVKLCQKESEIFARSPIEKCKMNKEDISIRKLQATLCESNDEISGNKKNNILDKPPCSIDAFIPVKTKQLNIGELHRVGSASGCEISRTLKRSGSELSSRNLYKRPCISLTHEILESPNKISDDILIPESTRKPTPKDNSPPQQMHESHTKNETLRELSKENKSTFRSPRSLKKSRSATAKVKLQEKGLRFPAVKDPFHLNTYLKIDQNNSSQARLPSRSHFLQVLQKLPLSQQVSCSDSNTLKYSHFNILSVVKSMRKRFSNCHSKRIFIFSELAPTVSDVISTMQNFKLAPCIYQDAFYSNELDVPENVREWAGREFKMQNLSVPFLPEFDPDGNSPKHRKREIGSSARLWDEIFYEECRRLCGLRSWSIAKPPPTYQDVHKWFYLEQKSRKKMKTLHSPIKKISLPPVKHKISQIEGPTQKNKHGFKYSQHQQDVNLKTESHFMSIMGLEIHVNTRGNLAPNPDEDEIRCLFWCISSDQQSLQDVGSSSNRRLGIIVLSEEGQLTAKISKQLPIEVLEETSELDLMIQMVRIVRDYDPDILTGYEVHHGSWGYLIQRARVKYDYDLCEELARVKIESGSLGNIRDKWGFNHTSNIHIIGRHMINIWRAMRNELNLLQYTMENVVFHLLHRRIPHYTWADLTRWFNDEKAKKSSIVINYYLSRVQIDLEILERNELIERTCEQARLLGVDFFSVLSRGSQFKVESLMFRIAKPENFIIVSPSRKQVGSQNALTCLPLVMEPQSAFYNSPLLVLDFQSLYPSVMIAYNYCYSTFLGRIHNWRGTNKMGFSELNRQKRLLELLQDHIIISPNGMMYTKPDIRKSLLSKMLGEILETRVMIKSSMKREKDDKALQRLLNNRQLALKLIANVTYGYTSASFSGRMPCSEIADSIVQTGRETLERAIALIHSVKKWNAEVVYGDTDSLFVYLKGRTKDQAFDIGEEIAQTVTNISPRPIKLKFEKVYLPCVLIAKKRYVGFKYESRNQVEPEFDAKGIETVRRDGTPAEQKIEEKALEILLRTSDLSQVKKYFQSQCEKIMKGSISIQDFCFAREVKLGTYSDKGLPPPGALISTKKVLEGSRSEPHYGERVPYVVIAGAPGSRLIDRCVDPEVLLENSHDELDSEYYITKNLIPPLERIFNLTGANVRQWYEEMPKVQRARRVDAGKCLGNEVVVSKKTMESYMRSSLCLVCREKLESEDSICSDCAADVARCLFVLQQRLRVAETKFVELQKICQSCSQVAPLDEVRCDSKDCAVFYTRRRHQTYLKNERSVVEPLIRELTEQSIPTKDLDW